MSNQRQDAGPRSGKYEAMFEQPETHEDYVANAKREQARSTAAAMPVEEPGFWTGIVPVYGAGKQAQHEFETGHPWRGMGYTLLAATDVIPARAALGALGRGAAHFGPHKWRHASAWYRATRELTKRQVAHHWAVMQPKGGFGPATAWLFNQPWNLMPMDRGLHTWLHRHSNWAERVWYGTPGWAKALAGDLAGRLGLGASDPDCPPSGAADE